MNIIQSQQSFMHNAQIAWALLQRNMYVLRKNIRSMLIDGFVFMVTDVLLFGSFFPLLGMPSKLIGPLFMSSMVLYIIILGDNYGLRIVFDLHYNRFIDYQLTLPLGKSWLIGVYIASFVIETAILLLPFITIGLTLLGQSISIQPNWLLLCLMFLLILIFLGALFMMFYVYYDFDWLVLDDNLWPRRISPLFLLSAVPFPWKMLNDFAPTIAKCMLLNPVTYIAEGLRTTMLGTNKYLPAYICIPAMIIYIGIMLWLLTKGFKKRLDPV